ncbi:restriction endonuclease subunit S [Rhodococcus sp. 1163]|uniref:restriction endonuclease subunit S n=1 Tax=Rhodococcus sp. 1163 TaxID=1905289 RepID=UPI0009FE0C43|nr:restriction endonuclease subunit S [Rhodococcus sp. 1163]
MSLWPVSKLKDAEIDILDCEHKTPPALSDGAPYVAIPNIIDGRIRLEDCRRISIENLNEWTRRTRPQGGDLVITRRGRVGDTAPIPNGVNCAMGQNLVIARSSGNQVDPSFLRWATRTPQWRHEVDRLTNVGAIFNSLNVRDISNLRIPLPPIGEQRKIAAVFDAIDEKMTLNSSIVATAEALSDSAMKLMLTTTTTTAVPLSATARFVNGKAFTKEATGAGRVVIRIAELNSGLSRSTVYSEEVVSDDYMARSGDILFAWSGSLTLHRWYREQAIINQHIFKVIPSSNYPRWLVFQLIKQKLQAFKNIAADKATTMGHIQRKHLDEPVPIPDSEDIQSWDSALSALWNRALAAEQESEQLSTLRDTLLPQLLSGRLRLRETAKRVEDVL